MMPVESNISLKSVSWIIFLLRSCLSPFCSPFVGTGVVFSTGYHSSLGNGGTKTDLRSPCVRSVLWGVSLQTLQLSWPAPHCRHCSPVLVTQNLQEL